ncbi:hypothetical protein IKE79_01205 [Candidatus Saccharibacteria bacterium]|nr:hypothetical protein [Candidatus Saccharibacteria bacterium]
MLISANNLIGTPILSMHSTSKIATIDSIIVDPDALKIIAFRLTGPLIAKTKTDILTVSSIREHSSLGIIIDSTDDLAAAGDVVKVSKILSLNFNLVGLKVETRKGSKLGRITDYTVTDGDYAVQQLIVKRPLVKSFVDPTLTIPRHEITEITDYKVIVKDEEKVIKARAEKEDFIPNFVNPFRQNSRPAHARANSQIPADTDTE